MPVTDVTTDENNLTLSVTAEFPHPVERVWDAYTDPRQLERFWGPPTYPATFSTWELRPGGRALHHMTGLRGEKSYAAWEFLTIEAPKRLVVLDSFTDEDGNVDAQMATMRMELEFFPTAEGTRMVSTSRFASLEDLRQVVAMGIIEGTTLAMGQIDAVLAGLRAYAQGRGTVVELLDETSVRITRLVEGPRDLIWRAHHEPDLLRRWMLGPDGWELTTCEVAGGVGERYRYAWTPVGDTPGEPFGFEGELLLSDAPARAVTTEQMTGTDGPETVNDLTLVEDDGATLITTVITYPDERTRDAILATGMADGMETSYARLQDTVL